MTSPAVSRESQLLLSSLNAQREHVLGIIEDLDAAPSRWPEYWQSWRLADLREIMLHVITETACHTGHLDAARELIDGRTWMVVTGQ